MHKNYGAVQELLKEIRLKDVMTTPVTTVVVDDDFSCVEEMFVKNKIRHLPVVNHDEEIVGVVSQKDVYRRVAPRRSSEGKVLYHEDIIVDKDGYYEKDSLNKYILNCVMKKKPYVLKGSDCLGDAIHLMTINNLSCVPIVDEKRHVVGIITRIDILKFANAIYTY